MLNSLSRFVKSFFPKKLIIFLQDLRYSKFADMPTDKLFTQIYENKFWGDGESEFYSGLGSDENIINDYVQTVSDFIVQNNVESITDIGCGDFRVGKSILERLPSSYNIKYTGVDIVESLILHNQKKYGSHTIQFKQINAIKDQIPSSDLCTIRQVLQHLDNAQIMVIVEKIQGFKYALLTEEQPFDQANATPNIDKKQGPHVRTIYNSGVYLEKPPFNLPVNVLLESNHISEDRFGRSIKTILKTYLLKNIPN